MRERLMFNDEPHSVAPTLCGHELMRTFGSGEARTTALAGVTLDLYPGHLALLMGPSGSGKSTLLAVLSGLLKPDGGQAIALGQDIWKQTERQREDFRLKHCGFIFQGYNLFPALTALQQLEMVLRWGKGANSRDARRKALEMLDLLGLVQARGIGRAPQRLGQADLAGVAVVAVVQGAGDGVRAVIKELDAERTGPERDQSGQILRGGLGYGVVESVAAADVRLERVLHADAVS